MDSFTDFALNEEYKRLQSLEDKLAEIEYLVDWMKQNGITNEIN